MLLHKLSDKVVFNTLSGIKVGYLEITSYQGETFRLGNPKDNLKAKLIIKKPNFSFNLIRGVLPIESIKVFLISDIIPLYQ